MRDNIVETKIGLSIKLSRKLGLSREVNGVFERERETERTRDPER